MIIDDFGNRGDGTEAMLNLGIPITAAVMPFLRCSQEDADAAHAAGHEVILHIPMEPEQGKASWLGPNGITVDLSDSEIRERMRAGFRQIKYATGLNNHMDQRQ